jgi:hypothetical protein
VVVIDDVKVPVVGNWVELVAPVCRDAAPVRT